MRPPQRLTFPSGSTVLLIGVVRGLAEDSAELLRLLRSESWDVVGVGCAPERWGELEAGSQAPTEDEETDPLTDRYLRHLARWGIPEDPERWLERLKAACEAQRLACEPLDLPVDRYADRAAALIGGWALARQALRLRRMRRGRISAPTPEEFVSRWERATSPGPGFRALEAEQESFFAAGILRLVEMSPPRRILAIVEAERYAGVLARLESQGSGTAP